MKYWRIYKKILRQRTELAYAIVNSGIPEIYPDFMCIGAPRSGTTWLSNVIRKHPDHCVTRRKEMHFFDEPIFIEVDGRLQDGNTCFYGKYFDMKKKSHWRWYYLQFRHCPNKLKGDITPGYSRLSEERIELISEKMPMLKLIYMIRNPIERAWSAVRNFAPVKLGKHVGEMSIDEIMNFTMIPRRLIGGNYSNVISRWEKYFSPLKIHYVFYDDLVANPYEQAKSIYKFLGADPRFLGDSAKYSKRVNASADMNPMPDAVFDALMDYYRDQIKFLAQRFSRNFDHWMNY